MGRTSTKENKNSYQLAREELGLTREKASELLETIAPERIEKIENERTVPRPDEVLTMAEKYKRPSLCNCYCSQQCPIGQRYVPFVTRRELLCCHFVLVCFLEFQLIQVFCGCLDAEFFRQKHVSCISVTYVYSLSFFTKCFYVFQ